MVAFRVLMYIKPEDEVQIEKWAKAEKKTKAQFVHLLVFLYEQELLRLDSDNSKYDPFNERAPL